MNIENIFTTIYIPETNGKVERHNGTILTALHTYEAYNPRQWDLYTNAVSFRHNNQP